MKITDDEGIVRETNKKSRSEKKRKLEGKEFETRKVIVHPFFFFLLLIIIMIFASALENQPGADDQNKNKKKNTTRHLEAGCNCDDLAGGSLYRVYLSTMLRHSKL